MTREEIKEILFSKNANKNNITIYYTSEAWMKISALVQAHQKEIAWNMVVKPYKSGYKIYDVLVYPQKVSSAYVSVDTAKYGIWKSELTDEQDANLFGQAHSHVHMSCIPSINDLRNQAEELAMKNDGFLLFQIYNKEGDVWSILYELEKKKCYENISYEIETDEESLTDFVNKSFNMITGEILTDESEQVV